MIEEKSILKIEGFISFKGESIYDRTYIRKDARANRRIV